MIIRSLEMNDFPLWLPLWNGNNQGQINADLTTETWSRITNTHYPVHGLGAFEKDQMRGLIHYVLHPTTGSIQPVCYMQDVYVDPPQRRKGIAKAMTRALVEIGQKQGWARLYWLAEAGNEAAQNLYKTLGVKMDFTLHIVPLGK